MSGLISISSSSDSLESEMSSYTRELKISNDKHLNIDKDHVIHDDLERYGSNIPFTGIALTPPGSPIPILEGGSSHHTSSSIKTNSHIYVSEFISLILFHLTVFNIDIGYYLLFNNITNIYIMKIFTKSIMLYILSFLFLTENNISYVNLHPVFTIINFIFYNYSIIDVIYFISIQVFTSFLMSTVIIYLNYNLFISSNNFTVIKMFLPFLNNNYEDYYTIIYNYIISYVIFSFIISYNIHTFIDQKTNNSKTSLYHVSKKILLNKCQTNFIIILLFGYHSSSSFNITLEMGVRIALSIYYKDTFAIFNTINNYSIVSEPLKYLLFIEIFICIVMTVIGYYISKKLFEIFKN